MLIDKYREELSYLSITGVANTKMFQNVVRRYLSNDSDSEDDVADNYLKYSELKRFKEHRYSLDLPGWF